MNYGKIAKLIKKEKCLTVMEEADNTQWVGNNTAIYQINGMPYLNDDELAVFLGLSGKDEIPNRHLGDTFISIKKDGSPLEEIGPSIIFCGETYRCLCFKEGAFFVSEKTIAPIYSKTVNDDNIRFKLSRYVDNGVVKTVITAEYGFHIIAVFLPLSDVVSTTIYECYERMNRNIAKAIETVQSPILDNPDKEKKHG